MTQLFNSELSRDDDMEYREIQKIAVIFLTVTSVGILAATVGVFYQNRATQEDMKNYPPPGKMVEVDGLKYHLNCMGTGSPTVILEAGLGENSLSWYPVQSSISRVTQVCAYDRAGLGWSEGHQKAFSLDQISEDLHQLLNNDNIKPPYIMVGFSRGGIYVRNFFHHFRNEVTGMVLVDSTHERSVTLTYPHHKTGYLKQKIQTLIAPLLSKTGVIRLMGWANADRLASPLPKNILAAKSAVQNQTSTALAIVNEIKVMREDINTETRSPLSLGDLPLVVLTSGKLMTEDTNKRDILMEIKIRLQNELVALSSNSQHIIANKSGHFIMYDQPELVIESIVKMVKTGE